MTGNWRQSHQPSHSTEIEHRVTVVESELGHQKEVSRDRYEEVLSSAEELEEQFEKKTEAISKRLSLHEKAILALASALQIVAQDKYPAIAKAIRQVLIP